MESQQVAFRKTRLKDENYEKQRKNQLLEWLAQQGRWYPGIQWGRISGALNPKMTL